MSSYEQALVADYAARRARLWGGGITPPANDQGAVVRVIRVAARRTPAPLEVIRPAPGNAPLNMLTECSWRFLVAYAALRTGVKQREILSDSRSRDVIPARYFAIGLVFQHTQGSLPQIGRAFGRDHSTILHALRKHGVSERFVETPSWSITPHKNQRRIAGAGEGR